MSQIRTSLIIFSVHQFNSFHCSWTTASTAAAIRKLINCSVVKASHPLLYVLRVKRISWIFQSPAILLCCFILETTWHLFALQWWKINWWQSGSNCEMWCVTSIKCSYDNVLLLNINLTIKNRISKHLLLNNYIRFSCVYSLALI